MEKRSKEKKKLQLKKSRKNINTPQSKEDDAGSIRSVYFDLEGDIVYDTMKYIRGYQGAGNIPADEMELLWPILKTKSLLYLQNNARNFTEESTLELLKNLDLFAIDDSTIAELLGIVNTEKYKYVHDVLQSIWTTKEEYVAKFKPSLLTLFYDEYLRPSALMTLKNQVRVPQDIKTDDFPLFSHMPNELISKIASYLMHPVDVVNFSKCNKLLHDVCEDSKIWSKLCKLYEVKVCGKNVKQIFAAYYLKPVDQIMYAHGDEMVKYRHIVIPSEELRVLDYSLIQQKYMLDDICTMVLVVNMKQFDKRLEKYKYNRNYIHENVGFLKDLIVEAPKHHPGLSAIVVLLLDTDRQAYKEIEFKASSPTDLIEDFPNLAATDPQSVLKHIVMLFKELSFDVANVYQEWKPELLVQYEDLKTTQFFVDNFLRILRHMKLRPIGSLL